MVVRVDTTNLTRGLNFEISISDSAEPTVSLYAFNVATHTYEALDYTLSMEGVFYKVSSKAPYFDGFLLVKINKKSMVVKKIGYPASHFVIGYMENYSIPYKTFNNVGVQNNTNTLINIVDGFYYCEFMDEVSILEVLKKRFIIKDNYTKFNFDVSIGDAELNEISLPDYELNTTLSESVLQDIELETILLSDSLPTVNLKEF